MLVVFRVMVLVVFFVVWGFGVVFVWVEVGDSGFGGLGGFYVFVISGLFWV